MHQRLKRLEGFARINGRAFAQVGAKPAFDKVGDAFKRHQALNVVSVVNARMGGVFADELIGLVFGGYKLIGAAADYMADFISDETEANLFGGIAKKQPGWNPDPVRRLKPRSSSAAREGRRAICGRRLSSAGASVD